MKKFATVLLVSLAFAPAGVSVSHAAYACSSETRDAEVPSGSQTDENGRTWVGFKNGGLPPDSLSKSSEVSSCDKPS